MTSPNPYDGLIERQLPIRAAAFVKLNRCPEDEMSDDQYLREFGLRLNEACDIIEALTRLTRDVEEAKETLAPFAAFRLNGFSGPILEVCQPDPGNPSPRIDRLERRDFERASATLTRLSRPTDLDADPAFVASQSSRSVSTKGFNRGERGEGN